MKQMRCPECDNFLDFDEGHGSCPICGYTLTEPQNVDRENLMMLNSDRLYEEQMENFVPDESPLGPWVPESEWDSK